MLVLKLIMLIKGVPAKKCASKGIQYYTNNYSGKKGALHFRNFYGSNYLILYAWGTLFSNIMKTHVRGFFGTDLHEVSWHFATHEAVRLTEWRSVSKKPFKMGFCFYPTLKKKIQSINRLKTVSKVGDLPSTIVMTAHCFGALSQVRAIGHCVIGQERDLL